MERIVRVCDATDSALVLGSHQSESEFSASALDAAGLEVARRRSGGSAVLVGGGRVLWADFVIPKGDPLWDDDVGRAAWWVGEVWARAIGTGEVWQGPLKRSGWSATVCFTGIGPGEVTIEGRKVVGVCQRRTARGALFQTAALIDWRPHEYASLLAQPREDIDALIEAASGLEIDAEALEARLLEQLGS